MSYNKLKENLVSVNNQLRKKFDSDDPIRTAFRIGGLRRSGGKRGSHQTPQWALNKKAMRKILLRSFPRMNERAPQCKKDPRCRCAFHQRRSAARWAYISYLYWQMGLTQGDIVCDLNQVEFGLESSKPLWNLKKVNHILYHLNLASRGRRSDGSSKGRRGSPGFIPYSKCPTLGSAPVGRSKKIHGVTAASASDIRNATNGPRSNS